MKIESCETKGATKNELYGHSWECNYCQSIFSSVLHTYLTPPIRYATGMSQLYSLFELISAPETGRA
jgi:hypothetical protein